MFVRVVLTFNASARACGRSDGKPEDLRCNLQNHMQRYVVARFNAIDVLEEAQRKAQEKVKRHSNRTSAAKEIQRAENKNIA